MCLNHEHKYRISITIGSTADKAEEKFDIIFHARSITEAISKADGYAFENYPGRWVSFTTHHAGYRTEEGALEHGALLTSLEELAKRKGLFLQGPGMWFGVQLPS